MQTEINIQIGSKPPAKYFSELAEQTRGGKRRYGNITDAAELRANLAAHCIPLDADIDSALEYDEFLVKRRQLMADKVRKYYRSL